MRFNEPRWSFDEFEEELGTEVKEELHRPVSRLNLLKRALLSLLGLTITAFAFGLIVSSFCMGIYIGVDWFKEWIK